MKIYKNIFFPQYNDRWFVLKDDCIYYMDSNNSMIRKNIYVFDKASEIKKVGKDIISFLVGDRYLMLSKILTIIYKNSKEINSIIMKIEENIYNEIPLKKIFIIYIYS